MLRSFAREGQRLFAPSAVSNPTSSSWAGLTRLFHGSAPQSMPDVFVPSMGDSISEGTIAAILKQQGQSVQVDEVIAQIETDKVTIDIKSTEEGILEKLAVAAGSIVKPGDLVATISKVGASSTPAAITADAPPAAPSTPAAPTAPSSHDSARTPSISFPPRIAPSGERISSLPAAKQDEILGLLAGRAPAAASKPAPAVPAAAPAPAKPPPAVPAAAAAAAAPPAKPAKVQTTILKEAPARRQLSQREIDFINSGGAP